MKYSFYVGRDEEYPEYAVVYVGGGTYFFWINADWWGENWDCPDWNGNVKKIKYWTTC